MKLVIPTYLQMGWIESPAYFCAASETVWGLGKENAQTTIGGLPDNKYLKYTKNRSEYLALFDNSPEDRPLKFMMEVYVIGFYPRSHSKRPWIRFPLVFSWRGN